MKQRTFEKAIYAAISKYFFRVAALELIFKIVIFLAVARGLNYLMLNPLNVENNDPFGKQFIKE